MTAFFMSFDEAYYVRFSCLKSHFMQLNYSIDMPEQQKAMCRFPKFIVFRREADSVFA